MSPARRRSGWESPACIDELAFYRQSKSLALTSPSILASVKPRLSYFPAKQILPQKLQGHGQYIPTGTQLGGEPETRSGQPAAAAWDSFAARARRPMTVSSC